LSGVSGVSSAMVQAMQQQSAATEMMPAAQTQGQVPFANLFQSMMQQSNDLNAKAQQAVVGLMNGSGVEVHDAMIATQKADMAFELGLQVRNKAVAAYQQMMNMQF
jgi:flagellar hook-basal body complex protein FliE